MILLHLISDDEEKINTIADILVQERLILNAVLIRDVKTRRRNKDGNLETIQQTLMTGKTKALLFNEIEKRLLEMYSEEEMPVLYSVPIVNMEWHQTDELKEETKKI